jgi:hypothetical protein
MDVMTGNVTVSSIAKTAKNRKIKEIGTLKDDTPSRILALSAYFHALSSREWHEKLARYSISDGLCRAEYGDR